MTLSAEFTLTRGPRRLELGLELSPGETRAIVGPNGAGKSTLLAALAGLAPIERGAIRLGERVLDGGPGGPFVPPEERGVGLVFQEPRLFPALSARDNVAFGLRSRGRSRREARIAADAWLERLGVAARRDARPHELSGGEAQRVALARTLATEPALLLLDEPLSAVDASARLTLRAELRGLLAERAGLTLVVVHDVEDALALTERLAVLEDGRLTQEGTLADLAARPRSAYVADLVGTNRLVGTAEEGRVTLAGGRLSVAHAESGPVALTVHPRAISLFRQRPEGSPRNVWEAPVEAVEPALDRLRVRLGGGVPLVAEITPAAAAELAITAGDTLWVAIKATEIRVVPVHDEAAAPTS